MLGFPLSPLPHSHITSHARLPFSPPCYTILLCWWPYPPSFLPAHPHFLSHLLTIPHYRCVYYGLPSPYFPDPQPHITCPYLNLPSSLLYYTIYKAILCFTLCPFFPLSSASLPFPVSLLYHSIHGYAFLFTTYRFSSKRQLLA